MSNDPALALFRADAKAQGLSLAEYALKYGLTVEGRGGPNLNASDRSVGPDRRRLRRDEPRAAISSRVAVRLLQDPTDSDDDGDYHCLACARKAAIQRDTG